MRAREFFQSVRLAVPEIRRIRARSRVYTEMATVITASAGDTPCRTGGAQSKVERAALGLLELAQRLGEQAERYEASVREAERVIACLRNPRHRQILSMRCVECMSWERISAVLGVSDERNLRRCYGRALRAAESHIPENIPGETGGKGENGPCMAPPYV